METIQSEHVVYAHGDVPCEGYMAWDGAREGPRPGILVAHTWMGLAPFIEERTRALAGLGYVALALDLYGRGVRPHDREEAARESARYGNDPGLLRGRARAALDRLRGEPRCADRPLAAIGYCFGGHVVLELARDGAELAGVVSFHGMLATHRLAGRGGLRAKVLALHGAEDPIVPVEDVLAFQREMQEAGADWQLVVYGASGHGFTNPAAGSDRASGLFYQPDAERRSWQAMRAFLAEVLG
ncbi:MAG: dienelactone hydrolase family protein [Acidobacteria bacterium]|nr:dienelactone hydrolase family protein [Acidobacteriota bacterium]